METVAEGCSQAVRQSGSQDRPRCTQLHRQQRRLHEAAAGGGTSGRSATAKYYQDYQVTQVTMKFVWGE